MSAENETAPGSPPDAAKSPPEGVTGGGANDTSIDIQQAKRYLRVLDPERDGFEFRTFDDNANRGNKTLARKIRGTLEESLPMLRSMSRHGAGVFAVVNYGGQLAKEITRVRAVFADSDGGLPIDRFLQCGLEPHLVVQTSEGKVHVYWLVDDLPLAMFARVQAAIAAEFGTDPTVTDLPRVLRLPGFPHQKGDAFDVRIVWESGGLPYSASKILAQFPPVTGPTKGQVNRAVDGEAIVIEKARHEDARTYTWNVASEARRNGEAKETAWARVIAERGRGRWTRDMADDELRRMFDGAWERTHNPPQHAPERAASDDDERRADAAIRIERADGLASHFRPDPIAEARLQRVPLDDVRNARLNPLTSAIHSILPDSVATVLGAHGGIGKTIQALVWCAHVNAGIAWAGLAIGARSRRVVFVSLEDPADLIQLRLRYIADAYGLELDEDEFVILDGTATDAALAREVSVQGCRALIETGVLDEIRQAAVGAALIVIDNASDGFDGDENSRRQVRVFLRMLSKIARQNACALLLLVHVDKAAAKYGAAGNSYSGSTAWHNGPRSRLALVDNNGVLELRQEKANLSRRIEPIALRFNEHGVLMPMGNVQTRADDDVLLAAMARAISRGDIISAARTGPGNTFTLCRTLPGFPASMAQPDSFWSALSRLFEAGQIVKETYRNENRKSKEKWSVAPVAPVRASSGISATRAEDGAPCASSIRGYGGGAAHATGAVIARHESESIPRIPGTGARRGDA